MWIKLIKNLVVVKKMVYLCNMNLVRSKSTCKFKYSSEVEALINKQIQVEHQAAHDYLNLAVTFLNPHLSRPGAGGFFMHLYEEEIGHMKDFIQYQLTRGGQVILHCLNKPNHTPDLSLLQAFTLGLEFERKITEILEQIIVIAEKQKDYRTADFITSEFLKEQMISMEKMMHHVTKLSRLSDEHSLYHYDLSLLKSHPYTFKSS